MPYYQPHPSHHASRDVPLIPMRACHKTLVKVALLTLLSIWGIGNPRYRWMVVTVQLFGFGCATTAIVGVAHDRRNGILLEHHQDVVQAVGEMRGLMDAQMTQIHQQYAAHLSQMEQQYNALQYQYQHLQSSLNGQQEQEQARLDEWALDLEHREEQLQWKTAQQDAQIQQMEAELEQSYAQLQHARQRAAEQAEKQESEFIQRVQAAQAELQRREESIKADAAHYVAEQKDYFMAIAHRAIAAYERVKIPEYPLGSTHSELLARDVIRVLHEHHVIVKKPVVVDLPAKKFSVSFEVFPVLDDGEIKTAIRSTAEALKIIEKEVVLNAIRLAVPGCSATPVVAPDPASNLRLKLVLDVSGVDLEKMEVVKKEKEKARLTTPDRQHLVQFVQANPHINFMADSGWGKTTFLSNLIDIAVNEWGDTEIIGVNPKPDEYTDLSVLKYIGFDESINGLLEAATEICFRVETNNMIARKNRDQGLNHTDPGFQFFPIYQPKIFLIDECTEIMKRWNNLRNKEELTEVLDDFQFKLSNEKKGVIDYISKRVSPMTFASDLMQICWRVGRSEKVKLFVAGQNLKANIFKVNITDINQLAYIYAGEAIGEGMSTRVNAWHKDDLQAQMEERSRLVEAGEMSKFYGLFVPKEGKPYFAAFPQPGAYRDTENAVNLPINSGNPSEVGDKNSDLGSPQTKPADLEPTESATVPSTERPTDSKGYPEVSRDRLDALLNKTPDDPSLDPDSAPPSTQPADPQNEGTPLSEPSNSVDGRDDHHTTARSTAFFDIADPDISEELIQHFLTAWVMNHSQGYVIEKVWGLKRDGDRTAYRVAKGKFRRILRYLKIDFPNRIRPWGEESDDSLELSQLIDLLEEK
ncbi:MAG: hypothetical protein AB4042_08970 [Leptolyngbyaceae cyanobacterium]